MLHRRLKGVSYEVSIDLHVHTHVPHMAWLNLITSSTVCCGDAACDDDEYHLPTTHDCISLAPTLDPKSVSCYTDASLLCQHHCMQAMHLQVCTTLMRGCRSCTKRPCNWCHVADQHPCSTTPHGGQPSHFLSPKVSMTSCRCEFHHYTCTSDVASACKRRAVCTNWRPLPPLRLVSNQFALHCRVLAWIGKASILHSTCSCSFSGMHAAPWPPQIIRLAMYHKPL